MHLPPHRERLDDREAVAEAELLLAGRQRHGAAGGEDAAAIEAGVERAAQRELDVAEPATPRTAGFGSAARRTGASTSYCHRDADAMLVDELVGHGLAHPTWSQPVVQTASFSGNAFSVKKARGRFRSPRGHGGSSQNVHRYLTARSICSSDSASPNAGMWRSRPRTGPPRCATAIQSPSGSTVLRRAVGEVGKVVAVGQRQLEPDDARGEPVPSIAWQVAQAARKICSPVAFGGQRRVKR